MKQCASIVTGTLFGRAPEGFDRYLPTLILTEHTLGRAVRGRITPIRSYFLPANPTLTSPCRSIYFLQQHTARTSGCDSKRRLKTPYFEPRRAGVPHGQSRTASCPILHHALSALRGHPRRVGNAGDGNKEYVDGPQSLRYPRRCQSLGFSFPVCPVTEASSVGD